MDKKVALITGASGGIGSEIALEFARNGYDLILVHNTHPVDNILLECEKLGAQCLSAKCNLTNEDDINLLVACAMDHFGRIDVLVNNAGISIDTLFQDKTVKEFRHTLDVNLVGTFLLSKLVGAIMMEQHCGKIINITSTNGINTYYPMCVDYDASKAGLISLTHNLAVQFAPYVNVNAVAAGFIATPREVEQMDDEFIKSEVAKIFVHRVGTAKDVANLVAFLASAKADFINNEVIRIDGGQYGA
ncbi:MAG: SDR family oxidoreductase [Clostridia bacterium]|nr:SDR family oxidoreductase [Clostridia bacterium]